MALLDDEMRDWLLEGDASIRWKVMRDLLGAPAAQVRAEQALVATTGWGARLLAAQSKDGGWGGGEYSPKWTSTTYTLLFLHWLGLPSGHPAALAGCERVWQWYERQRRPETCVAGMLVLVSSSHGDLGDRLDGLVGWLKSQQLDDGGWNCAARSAKDKRKHSSFHTSMTALDALHTYSSTGPPASVEAELARGREFFLRHRLYKSHRTGDIAIRASTRFPQLPQWHFDVLRGLEHFAASGAEPDDRLADAVAVVRQARRRDGRWPTYSGYPGKTWFQLEEPGASRWNTVRALRVLDWWPDGAARAPGDRRHDAEAVAAD